MASSVTTAEMRKMNVSDLRKEIDDKQGIITKMRLTIELGAEKNSALYRREKRELARLLTILREKRETTQVGELKEKPKTRTVRSLKKSAPSS